MKNNKLIDRKNLTITKKIRKYFPFSFGDHECGKAVQEKGWNW